MKKFKYFTLKPLLKLNFLSSHDPKNKFFLLALRSAIACIVSMLIFQLSGYPIYGMWAGFYSWFLTQTDISDSLSNLNRCIYLAFTTILFAIVTYLGQLLAPYPLLFAMVLALIGFISGFGWYFSYIIFHIFIWATCVFAYTIMITQENISIEAITFIILISGIVSIIMCLIFAVINYLVTGKTFKFSNNLFEKEKDLIKKPHTYLSYGIKLGIILLISQYLLLIYNANHGFWVIITIVVCLLPTVEHTIIRVFERVLGTLTGAIIGYLIIYFFDSNLIVLEIVFPLTLFITYYYRCYQYYTSTIYLTLTTILFINAVTPGNYDIGTIRFVTTLIGAGIVLVFVKLIFPSSKTLGKQLMKIK